ncbi:hypothetical protein K438DRAFT_134302 [Mycena galopus ATCC 62051]|nr:hypothetical protein K438DRAFT_134302 [Mycena galopus ATCC 62051]
MDVQEDRYHTADEGQRCCDLRRAAPLSLPVQQVIVGLSHARAALEGDPSRRETHPQYRGTATKLRVHVRHCGVQRHSETYWARPGPRLGGVAAGARDTLCAASQVPVWGVHTPVGLRALPDYRVASGLPHTLLSGWVALGTRNVLRAWPALPAVSTRIQAGGTHPATRLHVPLTAMPSARICNALRATTVASCRGSNVHLRRAPPLVLLMDPPTRYTRSGRGLGTSPLHGSPFSRPGRVPAARRKPGHSLGVAYICGATDTGDSVLRAGRAGAGGKSTGAGSCSFLEETSPRTV